MTSGVIDAEPPADRDTSNPETPPDDTVPPVADAPSVGVPVTAPANDASVHAPKCLARGQLPFDYARPAVAARPRIELDKNWRWGPGWPSGVETLAFDLTKGEIATVPGITRIARDGKNTRQVWLRTTFDVQRADYFRTRALDLGGRYGTSTVYLNGQRLPETVKNAPVYVKGNLPLVEGPNVIAIRLEYSKFIDGVFWYGAPAIGSPTDEQRGLLHRRYTSKTDGAPHELTLMVPRCADLTAPNPLIVALPGWDGNVWSYAGAALMREADARGYLVLTPETFGNILYTDASEDGVMEALDLVVGEVKIDPNRVYITGLSMGGAGALQIGYHYPDRFAAVAAFYGDSQYSLGTGYIQRILVTKEQADRYSVIHFPENARNLPVLLVHAKDDKTSPFRQSSQLAKVDAKLGLPNHRLIDPKKGGHTLDTVDAHTAEAFEFFDQHRRPQTPARVTFRTNSTRYQRAYWATVTLTQDGPFTGIDAEWDPATQTVHILRLDPGATGVDFTVPAQKVTASKPVVVPVRVGGKEVVVDVR